MAAHAHLPKDMAGPYVVSGPSTHRQPGHLISYLVAETGEQLIERINERYPTTEGYHPVLLAIVMPIRATMDAHDEEENDEEANLV